MKFLFIAIILVSILLGCARMEETSPTQSVVSAVTPSLGPSHTPTLHPTQTATATPSASATSTLTLTPTSTNTATPTATYTPSATPTPSGGAGRIFFTAPTNFANSEEGLEESHSLYIMDSTTGEISPPIPDLSRFVGRALPSVDNQYLLLQKYNKWPLNYASIPEFMVLDTNSLQHKTLTASGFDDFYWLPDNRIVYLAYDNTNTIGAFLSSPDTEQSSRITPAGENVNAIFPTNIDKYIVWEKGTFVTSNGTRYIQSSGIYTTTLNGAITNRADDAFFPIQNVHPFSKMTYVHGCEEEECFGQLRNLETDEKTSILTPGEDFVCYLTSWAPDGKWMAFILTLRGEGLCDRIYLWSSETQEVVNLESYTDYGYRTSWSPDSKQIIIRNRQDNSLALFNVETMETTKLPETLQNYLTNIWSPDGRQIAFSNPWEDEEAPPLAILDIETMEVSYFLEELPKPHNIINVLIENTNKLRTIF